MDQFTAGFSDPNFWLKAVVVVVTFILSLTVHEFAHARVAFLLGDDTAAREDRMTLNPLVHIDIIGTIILPILGSGGLPVIGWAKPVPVTPTNFTRRYSMRTSHALVAAAGPVSNLLIALLVASLLAFVIMPGYLGNSEEITFVALFLRRFVQVNIALMIFNFLPIPPLDGSRLLPRSMDGFLETMERYRFIIWIGIILFGGRYIAIPVEAVLYGFSLVFGVNLNAIG